MAKYTNIGSLPITVRGVTINPGEIKDLKGFANNSNLLRITNSKSYSKTKKKCADKSSEVSVTPQIKSQPLESDSRINNDKVSENESKKDEKQNQKP